MPKKVRPCKVCWCITNSNACCLFVIVLVRWQDSSILLQFPFLNICPHNGRIWLFIPPQWQWDWYSLNFDAWPFTQNTLCEQQWLLFNFSFFLCMACRAKHPNLRPVRATMAPFQLKFVLNVHANVTWLLAQIWLPLFKP
jgi:hypothetical protein